MPYLTPATKKIRQVTVNKVFYQSIYQDVRWKRLRYMKFRDNPVCEICDAKGITKQTEEIHHKIPFERGTTLAEIERLAFDYDNLISVCIDCHKELHRHLVKSKFM